ncbi:MAG: alpha/beta hydrolase family protein [Anaerolineales bacterium]
MRILEITILLLNLVVLLTLYLPLRPSLRWFKFLPAVIVVLMFTHLIVEQYRWQMVPAYVLTGVLFLLTLPSLLKGKDNLSARGLLAFVAGGFAFIWWLVAVALPIILPALRLPTPPGPYAVGSVLYDWTDTTRAETYSSDLNAKRELMVQIWYPAQPAAEAKTIPFLDNFDVALPAFADFLKLPSFTLDHLRLVRTHAYEDAPIRNDGAPFPVIIYSHGYTGYRTASLNQMEALASSGYIAIAIDHPYAAAFTVFSNGRVVVNDPAMLPPAGRNQPGDQEAREELQATLVADERFVMDQLQLLNAGQLDARFAGKLDLQRIGLTGVSLGGGAIVWTCQLDARCKAGLVQDGWYEPLPETVVTEPLRQPFMFMQSETQMWKLDNLARLDTLYQGVSAPAFHLKFAGVLHADFGDYPLLTPLSAPLMYERGTLNGERTLQVVDAYLLAFFDQYLKNQPSRLLNGPALDYPEAQFESHSP